MKTTGIFYDILDKKRLKLLPLFKFFKKDFYLGGGTALSLQIGHRDSLDFDFFGKEEIDVKKIFSLLKNVFKGHKILKIQEEKNTLTVLIDGAIKVSFFGYPYKLLNKTIDGENIRLASIQDIGCMKLSAITSRASSKDYIDLYYILQKIKLGDLLDGVLRKFNDLDKNLILKSLVYFKDVKVEAVKFKHNNYVDFEKVKEFLKRQVILSWI